MMEEFLRPTGTIESDHPHVQARARQLTQGCNTDSEKAARLFTFVRDTNHMMDVPDP